MTYASIILASASPRRSQLLAQIGVRHEPFPVDLEERPRPDESPPEYVMRLARDKAGTAATALGRRANRPVLAADTEVVLDDRIFGKPVDEAHAVAMLMALGGRTHQVLTAVALHVDGRQQAALHCSRVTFRALGADECRRYCRTGEATGKAGAYAIQGFGAVFVERLEGSFSGVMGLPLFETAALLDAAGVLRWQADA
ncbi:MAG TPA: nucleoside triphosphate pyrophosphatase [Steroidobacteraceae bacterium]|nr:nucleoside triphosphate pyrophosphatase [Steroidobacteraceae bacterium]